MKNALFKDTSREIRRTLSRFISIFAIVAIGVSFFAGIKATGPDMKLTADKYFDDFRLMDIRLLSTIGFNDDDIRSVEKVAGVLGVMPSYSMDALVNIKDRDLVLKVLALPMDKINSPDESYINRLKLVQGRYPQNPGECVAEKGKIINSGMAIGSKIKLSSGTDKDISESLKVNEFTIVGIVETPYYISFERGTSPIGTGKVNSFIMIPQEDFKIPAYTDIYLTVNGAADKLSYDDSYDKVIEPVKNALEDVGKDRSQIRYDEIIKEANEKLESSQKELADAEDKQKRELADAEQKIEDSRKKISDGEEQLKKNQSQFNNAVKEYQSQIDDGGKKLEDGEKQYNLKLQEYNDAKNQADTEFPLIQQKIDDAEKEITAKEAALNRLKAAYSAGLYSSQEQKTQMEAQIKSGEQQLESAKAQLALSKASFEDNKRNLSEAESKLAESRIVLDNSKRQLDTQKEQFKNFIKSSETKLSNARKKLDTSKEELSKGESDYEASKMESDEKIDDARRKIADGEEQIGKIEKPVWYVLDRNTNPGFVEFGSAADRMDAIARVFPVFFFLVAALVCLTTMTRMVDEQRTGIGSLKALGYSKVSIASKYLLYAVLASITGSILGIMVGFRVFPTVIFNAYGILYTLPPVIIDFNTFYAILSTSLAVAATTAAALLACYKELMLTPAALMRPKSPKSGKRIFMERIKFIWNRLNFTQKVTARNLFRYKKRFFMTVLGIGGCTALLLSGFGLKDSIMSIVSKQFNELYRYDLIVGLKDSVTKGSISGPINTIEGDKRISEYLLMKEQNIDIESGDETKTVTLVVPQDKDKLSQFILFRDRITKKAVPFTDDGVVLSEKLANMLHVGIGDEINIKNEYKSIPVKVSGITENYVYHYVYMSPVLYKSVYGDEAKFQEVFAKSIDTSEDFENKLSTDLMKGSGVSSAVFTTGISKNFNDIIGSLNYIVLVLIVSAGILAFVVLYNLTNINISERLREIASIKVLGFYDREVLNYVYRENVFLTLIGMVLGLAFGIFLHKYIVVTAEVDFVMFGRDINVLSYVYSSILTIAFSGLVNFIMYFRLKGIKMVESLKSVD